MQPVFAMLFISMLRKEQSGFTLIELLVTIVIFGLVTIGIINLYISIEIAQRKSYHLEIATRAGEAQIESLRNSQYGTLTTDSNINFTNQLPADLPEPRNGTVHISEPESGLKKVDVTITYKDGKGSNTVKQSSYIGIIGIGQ